MIRYQIFRRASDGEFKPVGGLTYDLRLSAELAIIRPQPRFREALEIREIKTAEREQ
jgi:hypothetical protein